MAASDYFARFPSALEAELKSRDLDMRDGEVGLGLRLVYLAEVQRSAKLRAERREFEREARSARKRAGVR